MKHWASACDLKSVAVVIAYSKSSHILAQSFTPVASSVSKRKQICMNMFLFQNIQLNDIVYEMFCIIVFILPIHLVWNFISYLYNKLIGWRNWFKSITLVLFHEICVSGPCVLNLLILMVSHSFWIGQKPFENTARGKTIALGRNI